MIRSSFFALAVVHVALPIFAQPHAFPLSKQASAEEVSLDDMKWIVGRWQGKAMEGTFESTWNAPSANSLMGMFKFMKNEEVVFYELLTIVKEKQGVLLRLKHFDAKLVGWEAKEESIEFPFVSASKTEIRFDGLRFVRVSQSSIHVFVNVQQGEKTQELKFVYEPLILE